MRPALNAAACGALAAWASALAAQTPVSRDDAVAAALRRGARVLAARADSAVAQAARFSARARPNPDLTASYSKDAPRQHLSLTLPLDAPWHRGPRLAAADQAGVAATARYQFERAAIRFEVERVYLAAQAAAAHANIARRTALDADSLLRLSRLRRDAGDASDLDVELADVNAGQLANAALDDSLAHVGALLDLQLVMGLPADSVALTLADTLGVPAPGGDATGAAEPLPVAAAGATLRSAEQTVRLERASIFGAPSVDAGFERASPDEPGLLPTFGIALTLPLFDRRRGPIAQALAERDRAAADLAQARRESDAGIARARRERDVALARVQRDQRLLASAQRVTSLSFLAYREGAAGLPAVLEAARNAREMLARYVDDLAAAGIADAELRYLTTTGPVP